MNPPGLNPPGFGLLQRDRTFDHYQDLEAKYQLRPNVWVVPRGHWGRGAIQLVQLPTANEFNDNVVAFWVPAHPPQAGESSDLEYEIHWQATEPGPAHLGRVVATRIAEVPARLPRQRFVLDFDRPAGGAQPVAAVSCSAGAKVLEQTVQPNEFTGAWRLSFVVELTAQTPAAELRAGLIADGQPVSETWTYTWTP